MLSETPLTIRYASKGSLDDIAHARIMQLDPHGASSEAANNRFCSNAVSSIEGSYKRDIPGEINKLRMTPLIAT
jgi:hypothetical protein